MKRFTVLALAIAITACSDPSIDASSEEALTSSVKRVSEKLDVDKRAKFEESMQIIALGGMDLEDVLTGRFSPQRFTDGLYASLDGMTADEVISHAERIKAEREARERAQALEEIAELERVASTAEEARAELAKFSVQRSRFYQRERSYSYRTEPIIEISVRNDTAYPVSRAYFKGTIASPGRAVPWLVEDFNYSIAGGIEPGEEAEWVLAPNSFGAWGKITPPEDAVFTVEVVRLDGPDGERVLDAQGLSDRQKSRLQKLKEQYQ